MRHLLGDIGENPPLIEKHNFQIGWRRVEIAIVHPVRPFRRRHHHFGARKDQRIVFILDAVDVIGMEMRDHDRIDFFWIDSGGGEIGAQGSRRRGDLAAGAGVEKYESFAGIDDQGGERRRQFVVRHEGSIEGLLHFGERSVTNEIRVDRAIPDAVVERGELVIADPVAIDPRRRRTDRGGFRARAHGCGSERRRGGPEKVTPGQL